MSNMENESKSTKQIVLKYEFINNELVLKSTNRINTWYHRELIPKVKNVLREIASTINIKGLCVADDSQVGYINHYLISGVEQQPNEFYRSKQKRSVHLDDALLNELRKKR